MEVLFAQVERYENQSVVDGLHKPLGTIRNDMEELNKLTSSEIIDLAGRMIRNNKGEAIFNFGKHRSKAVLVVFKEEPGYYDWMMNNDFHIAPLVQTKLPCRPPCRLLPYENLSTPSDNRTGRQQKGFASPSSEKSFESR